MRRFYTVRWNHIDLWISVINASVSKLFKCYISTFINIITKFISMTSSWAWACRNNRKGSLLTFFCMNCFLSLIAKWILWNYVASYISVTNSIILKFHKWYAIIFIIIFTKRVCISYFQWPLVNLGLVYAARGLWHKRLSLYPAATLEWQPVSSINTSKTAKISPGQAT